MTGNVVTNGLHVGSPLDAEVVNENTGIALSLPCSEVCRRTEIWRLVTDLVEVEVEGGNGARHQCKRGIDNAIFLTGVLIDSEQPELLVLAVAEGEYLIAGR